MKHLSDWRDILNQPEKLPLEKFRILAKRVSFTVPNGGDTYTWSVKKKVWKNTNFPRLVQGQWLPPAGDP